MTENKDENTDSIKESLDSRELREQRFARFLSSVIQDFMRQLLFIASILTGFIFTILFDLVLAPASVNNFLLWVVFSFLLVSGFLLLACIILGAIVQFFGNLEVLDMVRGKEMPVSLFEFFICGSVGVFVAFLLGIFCFVISITMFGWIRSPWFGCLSIPLIIGLVVITFFGIKQLFSMLNKMFKEAIENEKAKETESTSPKE